MAKMKVYELAQEMGLQSKDILTALKNKGIEVKSHMSVRRRTGRRFKELLKGTC